MLRSSLLALVLSAFALPALADKAEQIEVDVDEYSLRLEFPEPMRVLGNMPERGISIEPALPLRCRWDDDVALECDVEYPASLPRATTIVVRIAPDLYTAAGEAIGAQRLTVDTERPSLGAQLKDWNAGVPQIVVEANMPVTADAAAAVLELRSGDRVWRNLQLKPLPVERESWEPEIARFALTLPADLPTDAVIELRARAGLASTVGPLRSEADKSLSRFHYREPFRLRGVVCAGQSQQQQDWQPDDGFALDCVPGEIAQLYFSMPPDEAGRKAFAAMLPADVVAGDWSASYDGLVRETGIQRSQSQAVEVRAPQLRTEVVLELVDTLRDAAGRTLQPARVVLRNGLPRPSLRAASSRLLLGSADSARVRAVNAAPTTVEVVGLGGDAIKETLVTPPTRGEVATIVSRQTRRVLADGGWVRWRASEGGALEMAAPQFDLSAQMGARQLVAWAMTWEDARPIVDAEVVLFLLDRDGNGEREIARARTGRDGVARLSLPEDFVAPKRTYNQPKSEWLLRAVSGPRRAVLPLGGVGEYLTPLGAGPDPSRIFIVTDRPLYRAGDSIRYRGWLREPRGGRLLRPAARDVELTLSSDKGERNVKAWSVRTDADGAFAGEIALPEHLVDGDYCIAINNESGSDEKSACVFVGTFRAQDLWVETAAALPLLRESEDFRAEVQAGYWSGGGAAGVGVQTISTQLTPASPAEAYPRYAGYRFAQSEGDTPIFLQYPDDTFPKLDADGKAQLKLPVRLSEGDRKTRTLPAFGRVAMTVEAGLEGRERVASAPASAFYARFDRYVGLRIEPSWFDARRPLRLQGLVIDAEGAAQADARIDVVVEYVPERDDAEVSSPIEVARCLVVAGDAAAGSACDVPRKRSGTYRFTARSGNAAPATIERDVWNASDARDDHDRPAVKAELSLMTPPTSATAPMRLLLRQPYAKADALLIVSAGGVPLETRVLALDRIESELTLPTFADGRNRVDVDVLVRERASSLVAADGRRRPPKTQSLKLQVDVPRPQVVDALTLDFDAARTTPGQTVKLRLRNGGERPRTLALTVFNDALRALAGARWDGFDPQGERWLGRRPSAWQRGLYDIGFDVWYTPPWQMNLSWNDSRRPVVETPSPVLVLERASLGRIRMIMVGDRLFESSAGKGVAASSMRGNVDAFGGGEQELDRVTVTGSRIARAAETGIGPATVIGRVEAGLALPERGQRPAAARALFGARLRRQFADTALWLPELRLAPGETREIEVVVPDNLSRWRAVAWSVSGDEDFEKAEAVLEAGLPLEVRLQSPVRVYPGDRAELVATARQSGEAPVRADAVLRVDALRAEATDTLALAARGQGGLPLSIAPGVADGAPRTLTAVAAVRASGDTDAVANEIELASPTIEARKVQAGWLGATSLDLGAPEFPVSAKDLRLRVSLLPGADAMVHEWIDDLQRYPHRCWEQILSRAVAAAIALARGDGERFPDARETIAEAVNNATVFQDEDGSFRYFADRVGYGDDSDAYAPLTAYSVRALRLLRELGYAVPATSIDNGETYLQRHAGYSNGDREGAARAAFVAAGLRKPERKHVDALWRDFDAMMLPAQVATLRAMAASDHPSAQDAWSRLLAKTKTRGEARVLYNSVRDDRWMSSELREQCELIAVALAYPQLTDTTTRRALIAGLGDLYAGGYANVDTQTGASCLMGLRALDAAAAAAPTHSSTSLPNNPPTRLNIARGDLHARLELAPGADAQVWESAIAPGQTRRALKLAPEVRGDAPASYIAEYRYIEDARAATSTAIGFALQRTYAVLRDGRWTPLASQALHDGDWVRITLTLDTGAQRYFVAITDGVPGGLMPADLALSGVGGLDLAQVSDTGSPWFRTRRLDPRAPKFYAEYLPPGRYEVHYFARVGNRGDYLAPPALAELMYGSATRARSAAERIRIVP